jgi:hypothetical protein
MRFPRARGTLIASEATHAASFTISHEMVGAYRADGGEHFQLNPVCADPAFVVVHERVVQTHRPTFAVRISFVLFLNIFFWIILVLISRSSLDLP